MSDEREESTVPDAAREEVVQSVMRALAAHGYAGLTTKRVAAESEKSEAFFFYHYDTKEDLIVAFLEWAVDRLSNQVAGPRTPTRSPGSTRPVTCCSGTAATTSIGASTSR
ncbi:TetR/AcrR family transcriptional regulator [Haloarcula regularis]|uniref:TetR/AcrR family transcriptional regulator n=1 Tax=Haloarcula regularis TaxID=3033392 RepID=UPI0023E88FD7|nr:TetR/AcrR family transcriptional regulator [Halomicroarcula sp. SYNS111]